MDSGILRRQKRSAFENIGGGGRGRVLFTKILRLKKMFGIFFQIYSKRYV